LWVAALLEAGYQVYVINPLAASRYRDRHAVSGAKSDPGDAQVLADLVRTDRHQHRQVAADSTLAEAVKVLARAHQGLVWARQRQINQLRSTLREFYPRHSRRSRANSVSVTRRGAGARPEPGRGRLLSISALRSTLRRAGRERNLDHKAQEIQGAPRSAQLAATPGITRAFATSVRSSVAVAQELTRQIDELEQELADAFMDHPDAEIMRSLPGLGLVLGARVPRPPGTAQPAPREATYARRTTHADSSRRPQAPTIKVSTRPGQGHLPRSVVPRRPRCVIGRCVTGRSSDITHSVMVSRAVPNIKSERPAETRDFFVELLGFEVAMDMGWVVTVASPTNPSVQVTIIGNDDMAAPGISVGVADADAVHAKAVEQGFEIVYPLRDEEWGVRRFMLREPSGTVVNVVSHRSD
jgi:transposase/catechol 2,3-dioxygenase-like lactoylglutathione lyase family enzyme